MTQDQSARYELKYAVNPETLDDMRAFLRPFCVLDDHASAEKAGFYTIDSLYFDDSRYRMYQDVEDGAPVRAKLRVRTYPDSPASVVKFEVKRRVKDLILKSSAVVPGQGWRQWLEERPRAPLSPRSEAALQCFLRTAQAMGARPKMLVRYERQAFVGAVDNNIRVTFDRGMQHQRMERYELEGVASSWTAMDDPDSIGAPGAILLELKFCGRAPIWMADLVRRYGLKRQGYSKYCSAVRRFLFDARRGWDLAPALLGGCSRWIF
jgi:hypothetical protein